MSGVPFLLEFFSSVALLLFATQMVRRAVDRAAGARIRMAISKSVKGRGRACLIGAIIALILQSSSATGLLVAAFAEKGLLALAPALALMLGADLGSSLAAQLLSIRSDILTNLLLLSGVVFAMVASSGVWRQVGRALVGIGLILFSLKLIVSVSMSLREAAIFLEIAESIATAPLLAFMLGAILTWFAHSRIATVLLVVSLSGAGIVSEPLGVCLILGANVGSGLVPIVAGSQLGDAAKQVLVGNIVFRFVGALLGLVLLAMVPDFTSYLGADPARRLLNLHLAFNVILAAMFLPFLSPVASLLKRFVGGADGFQMANFSSLQGVDFDRPDLALAAANREVSKLSGAVELMLNQIILTFSESDQTRREKISQLDDEVDRLQHGIKLFLSRLLRTELSANQRRECPGLLLFTTSLEHGGDIIDNDQRKRAAKRQRNGVSFSESGWKEIEALHGRAMSHMRLAVTVFTTRDVTLAKELVADKDDFRKIERAAVDNHFQRLKDGTAASIETSDIHLDILRDLKRIMAYLTSAAHPILETHGALRNSRLIAE